MECVYICSSPVNVLCLNTLVIASLGGGLVNEVVCMSFYLYFFGDLWAKCGMMVLPTGNYLQIESFVQKWPSRPSHRHPSNRHPTNCTSRRLWNLTVTVFVVWYMLQPVFVIPKGTSARLVDYSESPWSFPHVRHSSSRSCDSSNFGIGPWNRWTALDGTPSWKLLKRRRNYCKMGISAKHDEDQAAFTFGAMHSLAPGKG
jgi:hypothetical protein